MNKKLIEHIKSYPDTYQGKELQHLIWAELGIWLSEDLLKKIRAN